MILNEIVADKKVRLKMHKSIITEGEMIRFASTSLRKSCGFKQALRKKGLSIIGEFKNASPSLGEITSKIDLPERIRQYNFSVDAISCLTEEDHFDGSTDYFKDIREMTDLPMLRKDFIIDEYQIYEAKVIGADAILLIAAILEDDVLEDFYRLAHHLDMDVLVEVHDEEELSRAVKLGADIIGVNNRNLKDFTISLDTTKRLRGLVPKGTVFVSESGVTEDTHVEFLKKCDIDALLIGRALMEADSPFDKASAWKRIYDKIIPDGSQLS